MVEKDNAAKRQKAVTTMAWWCVVALDVLVMSAKVHKTLAITNDDFGEVAVVEERKKMQRIAVAKDKNVSWGWHDFDEDMWY